MPRARGDRRPNGPLWWILMALSIYAITSVALAISTAGKCGDDLDAEKEWQWIPPTWECNP